MKSSMSTAPHGAGGSMLACPAPTGCADNVETPEASMIDIYFGTGNGARALCATRPLFVIRVYAWENSEGWGRSHHHLRKVYRTSRLREGRRRRRRRRLAGAARVTRLEHLFFQTNIARESPYTKAVGLGGDQLVSDKCTKSLCEQGPVRRGPSTTRTRCCFLARRIHRRAGTLDIGAGHPCYFGR